MDLHRACVTLDFAAMTPSRRLLTLPAYAWTRAAGGMSPTTGAKDASERVAKG